MFTAIKTFLILVLLCFGAVLSNAASISTQELFWRIKNSSGEYSVGENELNVRPAANEETVVAIKPGDTIRTGANGGVLLVRGAESILVAANTVIDFPRPPKNEKLAALFQQAGLVQYALASPDLTNIVVETPYLAVTTNNASFQVAVQKDSARVKVRHGGVDVFDFKSGRRAHITAGQAADVMVSAGQNLTLSCTGELAPIRQSRFAYSPVITALASTIDSVQYPPAVFEETKSDIETADSVRQDKYDTQVETIELADEVRLTTETANVHTANERNDKKEVRQAGRTLIDAKATGQRLGILFELPRSDLAAFPAPATPTSNVASPRPADRSANLPAEAVVVRPTEFGNLEAATPSPSTTGSTGNNQMSAGQQISQAPNNSLTGHFGAGATRDAIAGLGAGASSAASFDAPTTRAAIAKFLATPVNGDQPAKPTESISNRIDTLSDGNDTLVFWGLPLGIGAFVTWVAAMFRQNQKMDVRPLDYEY